MVKKRESSILGVLFHTRTIPFVLIPFYIVHVKKFYRQATSRSLCLLDEFGKGTLTEG